MKRQGSITVFLSLCLLCIFALICVMVEQARIAGSRYYLQVAVNASLDTLFSQYHRELWKRYRILGLQYGTEDDVVQRLEAYIDKYLEVENWYPVRLETVELETCENLTDQGGDFLAQEVLDYMKYGVWDSLELMPEDGEQLWKDIKEATSAGTMSVTYDGQEREVQRLEAAVENLLECVEEQESCASDVREALSEDDPDGFYEAAADFRKAAGHMDALVDRYEKRAEQLRQALKDGSEKLENTGDDFQEDRKQLFEKQMNPYAAYVEEDGQRYQDILHQKEVTSKNLDLLQDTEALVEQLEAEYESSEEEAAYEENDAGQQEAKGLMAGAATGAAAIEAEAGENEEEEALSLAPAARLWEGYASTKLQLKRQKGDDEKRGFLEQVRNLAQGSLLELVLPEDMNVSAASLSGFVLPSRSFKEHSRQKRTPIDRVLINEYCGKYFLHALSDEKRQVQYETEYLLQGQLTDRENLEATIEQLFLVRQGLNLIHILSDSVKREEASSLAAVITGMSGIAPLMEIATCFIMVVWAMGEAVMDLRTLMGGGKVPLWKSSSDWQLSVEGLLSLGREKRCPGISDITGDKDSPMTAATGDKGSGLSYESYLKLLLLAEEDEQKHMRMLDVIQMNIQSEEPTFSLERCAYRLDIRGNARGKHVFFALPLVKVFVQSEPEYSLEAKSQKIY